MTQEEECQEECNICNPTRQTFEVKLRNGCGCLGHYLRHLQEDEEE